MSGSAESWWVQVDQTAPLGQADLLEECRILRWDLDALAQGEGLLECYGLAEATVLVMTQACDLKQGKSAFVTVCPVYTLQEYVQEAWVPKCKKDNPDSKLTAKALAKEINNLRAGESTRYLVLPNNDSLEAAFVVDLYSAQAVPKVSLEENLRDRLRLKSPYREHVSQAFGYVFSRVGLPADMREATKESTGSSFSAFLD